MAPGEEAQSEAAVILSALRHRFVADQAAHATPRHKGKVERGVDCVPENAIKVRTFESLQTQNDHLQLWESNVADTRLHGTTKRQVRKMFQDEEQSTLGALPAELKFRQSQYF